MSQHARQQQPPPAGRRASAPGRNAQEPAPPPQSQAPRRTVRRLPPASPPRQARQKSPQRRANRVWQCPALGAALRGRRRISHGSTACHGPHRRERAPSPRQALASEPGARPTRVSAAEKWLRAVRAGHAPRQPLQAAATLEKIAPLRLGLSGDIRPRGAATTRRPHLQPKVFDLLLAAPPLALRPVLDHPNGTVKVQSEAEGSCQRGTGRRVAHAVAVRRPKPRGAQLLQRTVLRVEEGDDSGHTPPDAHRPRREDEGQNLAARGSPPAGRTRVAAVRSAHQRCARGGRRSRGHAAAS